MNDMIDLIMDRGLALCAPWVNLLVVVVGNGRRVLFVGFCFGTITCSFYFPAVTRISLLYNRS